MGRAGSIPPARLGCLLGIVASDQGNLVPARCRLGAGSVPARSLDLVPAWSLDLVPAWSLDLVPAWSLDYASTPELDNDGTPCGPGLRSLDMAAL